MRIRITFSKRDALRYSSQLDVHKIWERSARRAGLPLTYSQGFHPQPKLSIANALPLGISSRAEFLEMRLDKELETTSILNELNSKLPDGMRISRVEKVDEKEPSIQTRITFAEYLVGIDGPISESDLQVKVEDILACVSLPRHRRGKQYDLRQLIDQLYLMKGNSNESNPSLSIFMRLSAREGATGRPEEVLDALSIPIENARIERIGLILS